MNLIVRGTQPLAFERGYRMKVLIALYLTGILYIILNKRVKKTRHKGIQRVGYIIGYTIPAIFWPLFAIMLIFTIPLQFFKK